MAIAIGVLILVAVHQTSDLKNSFRNGMVLPNGGFGDLSGVSLADKEVLQGDWCSS